jgi:N-acetylmuramoyl-L-alanine amidase
MSCEAQSQLSNIQYDSIRQVFQTKLIKYIFKEPSCGDYIVLGDTGIYVFDSKEAHQADKPEFFIHWKNITNFQKSLSRQPSRGFELYQKNQMYVPEDTSSLNKIPPKTIKEGALPLLGFKIALDPGHVAGDMATARLEGKYIQMKLPDSTKVEFWESEWAWFTARILQLELEKLGAKVLLTRKESRLSAFDLTYDEWYKQLLKEEVAKGKKAKDFDKKALFFRAFHKPELEKRVEKINQFQPDLTLVIHYNVDAGNHPWTRPTSDNFSMAFIGGAFTAKDLEDKYYRFNALRLLLTDDWENSLNFSKTMLQSIENQLKIPIIPAKNNQDFLKKDCMPSEAKGVYARNLLLNKQVSGTLCYIEPVYQDNAQECILLNRRDDKFEGKPIPKRVREIALCYLAGIREYLKR